MGGNTVEVFVRTRPTAEFAKGLLQFGEDGKTISLKQDRKRDRDYINNQTDSWKFAVDRIMHNSSQDEVYNVCGQSALEKVLDGFNSTVFTYGQTGAGKTFTTTGATENFKHRGLIPRAIQQIFQEVHNRPESAFEIRISYLEIYNETMVDLLSSDDELHASLQVAEDSQGQTHVKGLSIPVATSEEDALHYLFEGETNRSVGAHTLNMQSSRSHCVFTIHLSKRSRVESEERIIKSKLHFVDLAGSERVAKTNSEGIILKEAMYINKSLSFLEQVVIALADKRRDHIPYRQSKLTNVLKDSLGAEARHIEETISTLRFATRMMRVETHAVVNVEYDPVLLVKKYERDIQELKRELAMHDSLAGRSHIQYDPFSEEERYELVRELRMFISGENDDIPITNLRMMRELLLQFRVLYRNLESEIEERTAETAAGLPASGRQRSMVSASSHAVGGDNIKWPYSFF